MSKTFALASRELRAYFYSPIAYVAMAAFLFLAGGLFVLWDFAPGRPAEMRSIFNVMVVVLVFVLPVLAMRLISEERSKGTIECLMTAPVTDTQVVLGKFLGVFLFYLLLLVPTLLYLVILSIYGSPDLGPILAGYLGLVLIGMLYLSVGLLTSACTRVQIVSAVISFLFLLIMTVACYWLAGVLSGFPRRFLLYVGFISRYENFSKGTVPLNDVVFFLSLTALTLFVSVKVLEGRKWRM